MDRRQFKYSLSLFNGSPGSAYFTYPLGDCDDTNDDVHPGAPELCDGIDNQCPGDEGYGDVDEGCDMAQIPAGCFDMGDAFSEGSSNELPVHNVCISTFEMDVHEVTNAEYAECVDDGGCAAPFSWSSATRPSYYGNPVYDDFPVIYVDWNRAQAYCVWAGKRLPTEAEWEYAPRGGLAGKRYPWGDTISCSDANYGATDGTGGCVGDTSAVGSYPGNGYQLYDIPGNVYEWVNDWHDSVYYQYCVDHGIVYNPPGPASGTYRVVRAGSWTSQTFILRVAYRNETSYPNHYSYNLGFRCARGGAYGP